MEKREVAIRPSQKKGTISKRTKMVRDLVGEVVGLAPYEKRLMDMLKTGGTSAEKRMYKYAKRRVSYQFNCRRVLRDKMRHQLKQNPCCRCD